MNADICYKEASTRAKEAIIRAKEAIIRAKEAENQQRLLQVMLKNIEEDLCKNVEAIEAFELECENTPNLLDSDARCSTTRRGPQRDKQWGCYHFATIQGEVQAS